MEKIWYEVYIDRGEHDGTETVVTTEDLNKAIDEAELLNQTKPFFHGIDQWQSNPDGSNPIKVKGFDYKLRSIDNYLMNNPAFSQEHREVIMDALSTINLTID
jgi:hypothetical protein